MKPKDTQPLISLVIPIHNVEKFLDKCLQSVTRQTYRGLEIILVNDDSNDRSEIIAKHWQEKDSRIKYILTKKHNAALTRSVGIKQATGDLICFVDSDDIIHEDYVQSMYEAMVENDADIVTTKIAAFNEEDEIDKINTGSGKVSVASDLIKYFFDHYYWNPKGDYIAQSINAKLFKSAVLTGIDYSVIKSSVLEDNFTLPQIYKQSTDDKIILVDRVYYYYRQNPDSTMANSLSKKFIYDGEEIVYPEIFERAMDYIQKIFSGHDDLETIIQKTKIERYLALANHAVECNIQNKQLVEQIDNLNRELNNTRSSRSYRIGVLLLKPLHSIQHRLKRERK